MAIKENVLPLAQDSGSGYIRTVSSGGESQRTAFDTVKGAITADMDEAIADEADAREAADDQLQTEIDGKVDKVTGKGLSTNDFTDALKTKLDGIAAGAEVNVQPDWNQTNTGADDYIKNKPGNATTSAAGFMSAADKTKLDGIEAGAEVNIIETVKVNGTALVPDANRAVDVPAPTVDSALSTTSTNPIQNKVITGELSDLKEEINDKSNWTVGSAEQLVSDDASQTDVTPYTFRRSGGGLIPFNFTREELSKVVGGTVAWNQLLDKSNYPASSGIFTNNGDGSVTANGTPGSNATFVFYSNMDYVNNHVYFVDTGFKSAGSSSKYELMLTNFFGDGGNNLNVYQNAIGRFVDSESSHVVQFVVRANYAASGLVCKPQLTDLTAWNSTIAEYVYTLEQATAGSGVTWLREHFPSMFNGYHTYDPGSLQSVCVGAHECVGFNQWDEEWEEGGINTNTGADATNTGRIRSKNYIPIFAGMEYYMKAPASTYLFFYDADKNYIGFYGSDRSNMTFTPSSLSNALVGGGSFDTAVYMRFRCDAATYNNDITINISKTTGTPKNGDYVPYNGHTYPLSNVTLRGRFYLDSNNQLRADGDIYPPSGEVTRRYGVITLNGTEDWRSSSNADRYYVDLAVDVFPYKWENTVFAISNKYMYYGTAGGSSNLPDKQFALYYTTTVPNFREIMVHETSAGSLNGFKALLSTNPLTVVFELATPTTETADPYTAVQICDSDGTEEFVDALVEAGTRDVAIPAGTETVYFEDMASKLAELPPIPSAPSANGTYTLQAVVSSGAVTYQWTS